MKFNPDMIPRTFDPKRAQETAARLRAGKAPEKPLCDVRPGSSWRAISGVGRG